MVMRSISRLPSRSNRHSSTLVALAEKSAKFVPRPSQVAPSGLGDPAETLPLFDLRNEKDGSKGWDSNAKLRRLTRHNGGYRPGVPDIAPAVDRGIGIEDLPPFARERHAHAVVAQHLRGEIHHHEAALARVIALSEPRKDAVVRIVGNQPFEAGGIAVELVQRGQTAVEAVEIAHEPLDPGVRRLVEQMPWQADVVIPFAVLSEFRAHEHQLLARVAVHEGVVGTQVGEALPLIARHAAQDRALAVYDLVVRERQDEIFRERVMQSEQI